MNIDAISGSAGGPYRPRAWGRPSEAGERRNPGRRRRELPDDLSESARDDQDTVTLSTAAVRQAYGQETLSAQSDDGASPALKDPGELPDVLKAAVERQEDGLEVVALYDPETGAVVARMAPEEVIQALEEVLGTNEGRQIS